MLAEFEAIVERASGGARETLDRELRQAARVLLDRQFVFADDFQGGRRYELVQRHRAYFAGLFDALGFDLVVDEREQMVGLVSQEGAAVRRMTVEETLFLVALRIVYESRIKQFDLREGGRADATMAELWGLIEEHTRRQRPSPARCRSIADSFARNGLLRVLEILPDGDTHLEIRPAITRAVPAATAEALERYSGEGEGDDEGRAVAQEAAQDAVHDTGSGDSPAPSDPGQGPLEAGDEPAGSAAGKHSAPPAGQVPETSPEASGTVTVFPAKRARRRA